MSEIEIGWHKVIVTKADGVLVEDDSIEPINFLGDSDEKPKVLIAGQTPGVAAALMYWGGEEWSEEKPV